MGEMSLLMDLLLDIRELRACKTREIAPCFLKEVADQSFVLPLGLLPCSSLCLAMLGNEQEELQKIMVSDPFHPLGRRPGLQTNTRGAIPEVLLIA